MHQGLVNATLTSLSESFCAPINEALEWPLISVSVIVFNKVLLQSKTLAALVAHPLLFDLMYLHVALETILCLKDFIASGYVTLELL